ncbi:MAG: hypothetical protein LUQ40_01285 [Methanomicrobiales archaeon]|nr:hypothetical protein [Methanomicrobiales archaeon]
MQEVNEYFHALQHLWEKSLMMENPSEFHPVLYFHFIDTLAHLEYTMGTYAFSFMSIRNEFSREYLRWRFDEEKKGERVFFGPFINWMKKKYPDQYEDLPMVWKYVYDEESGAEYRSLRLVLDPDSNSPIPVRFFWDAVDEFFTTHFLRSLYQEGALGRLFTEFRKSAEGS